MREADAVLPVGAVVAAKYRIERVLGRGGMGVVYQARHLVLETDVAIKVLADDDDASVARFLNEARAAAKLRSEHIVQVTDVGTLESGQPFMVMELLEGQDLEQILDQRTRLAPDEAVDYVLQALAGLSEAHAAGVVHRDLKPSNLFLARRTGSFNRVKVLDFGVAKQLFAGVSTVTSSNSVAGSPVYMAPEHVRGERNVDGRLDIWSMGVILYELVTGELPFFGDNVGAVFAAILEATPEPPRSLVANLPPGLEQVILRCLRRDRDERWGSAVELAEALAPYASEDGRQALALLQRSTPVFRASLPDIQPRGGASLRAVSRTAGDSTQTMAPPPLTAPRRVFWSVIVGVGAIAVGVGTYFAFRQPHGGVADASIPAIGSASTTPTVGAAVPTTTGTTTPPEAIATAGAPPVSMKRATPARSSTVAAPHDAGARDAGAGATSLSPDDEIFQRH